MRHALHKSLPWRTIATNAALFLSLGGGILFVSTPVVGAWVFGIGAVLLIVATA